MGDSEFYLPVQIIVGRDCVSKQPELFRKLGQRALLVTGKYSAKNNGALADVLRVLDANGQPYTIFDQVMSNPTVDCVYQGAEVARQNQADFVIAIGGGSPMDAAKAIAWLACQDIPREKIFTTIPQQPVLPLLCIPTTAGTGSEVTQYSVLINEALQSKSSLSAPCLFAQTALLDGRYMLTLPPKSTVHTGLDALSHLVESILSRRADDSSRAVAYKGLKLLANYLPRLHSENLSLAERDGLLLASCLGGIAIAQTSTTAVHLMGYPLTYHHHIDHGRANGLLLGAYLDIVAAKQPQAIQPILQTLHLDSLEQLQALLTGLLGSKDAITEVEVRKFALDSIQMPKCQSGIVPLTLEEVEQIYRQSLRILV